MISPEKFGERLLTCGVASLFAAFWIVTFALQDRPEFTSHYVVSAIAVGLVGTWWILAVRILWRTWSARHADFLHRLDGPGRVAAEASGGVAGIEDVKRVKAVEHEGIEGLIIGKALYTGAVDLAEAMRVAHLEGGRMRDEG